MQNALFTCHIFAVQDSHKAALLFAGYRGKVRRFKAAIQTLNQHGYTVILYMHHHNVLDTGDPRLMLELIDAIQKDVRDRLPAYQEVISTGVSVGAGLGLNVQRAFPKQVRLGLYAGAGVSASQNMFEAPIFVFARRSLRSQGYTPAKLYALWKNREIRADWPLPTGTGFVMALGTRDKIVQYPKATATMQAWQAAGVPISVISKRCGHGLICRWFNHNIETLLREASALSTV